MQNKIIQNPAQIIDLPRDAKLVKTSVGLIQFGIPSETLKDSWLNGLGIPSYFIAPTRSLAPDMSNKAAVEFIMFLFYITQSKATIIADDETIVQKMVENNTLVLNPETKEFPTRTDFYYKNSPEYTANIVAESKYIGKDPNASNLVNIEHFTNNKVTLTKKDGETLIGEVSIEKTGDNNYILTDITFGSRVEVQISYKSKAVMPTDATATIQAYCEKNGIHFPKNGVFYNKFIPLSLRGGMDLRYNETDPGHALGTTTCAVNWGSNGKCTVIDPTIDVANRFLLEGMNLAAINTIYLSHLHEDHIAGFLQLLQTLAAIGIRPAVHILKNNMDKLVQIIKNNSNGIFSEKEISSFIDFHPITDLSVDAATKEPRPILINGENWYFFHSLHTLETGGFWTRDARTGKGHVFWTSDTMLNKKLMDDMVAQGIMTTERYELLLTLPLCEHIFLEKGEGLIHMSEDDVNHLLERNPHIPRGNVKLMHTTKRSEKMDIAIAEPGMLLGYGSEDEQKDQFEQMKLALDELTAMIRLVPKLNAICKDRESFEAIATRLQLFVKNGEIMKKNDPADFVLFYIGGGLGYIVSEKELSPKDIEKAKQDLRAGIIPEGICAYRKDLGASCGEKVIDENGRRSHYVYALSSNNSTPRFLMLTKKDIEEIMQSGTQIGKEWRRTTSLRAHNIIPSLGNSPLFSPLSPSEIEDLLSRHAVKMTVPKNAFLIEQGQKPNKIYVLLSGTVRITTNETIGGVRSIERNLITKKTASMDQVEVFGEMSLLEWKDRQRASTKTGKGLAKYNVETDSDVEVLAIDYNACIELVRNNLAVYLSLMIMAIERELQNNAKIRSYSQALNSVYSGLYIDPSEFSGVEEKGNKETMSIGSIEEKIWEK